MPLAAALARAATGSARSRRCCSASRRWASACSPDRCCRTCTSIAISTSARSAAASSMTVTGAGVLVALPFVAKRYDALYRRDPPQALRMIGMLIVPIAVLLPIQYFMPNETLFAIVGIAARRAAPQRVHHGRADHPVGRSVPAARSGHRARLDLRVLRRRDRRRPSSPRCSPARSARGARCCSSAFRRRCSAGC